MQFAVQKVADAGNDNVMITERGTTFGYTDLVVDYQVFLKCSSSAIRYHGRYPLLATTQPNFRCDRRTPYLIETIAKAAIAVGADGLFIETHPEPSKAKSDGANMLQLDLLEGLLTKLVRIREAVGN